MKERAKEIKQLHASVHFLFTWTWLQLLFRLNRRRKHDKFFFSSNKSNSNNKNTHRFRIVLPDLLVMPCNKHVWYWSLIFISWMDGELMNFRKKNYSPDENNWPIIMISLHEYTLCECADLKLWFTVYYIQIIQMSEQTHHAPSVLCAQAHYIVNLFGIDKQ